MNYRIVEERASTVVGKDVIIKKDPFMEIPAFVEEIWKNGTHDRINKAVGRLVGSLLYGYYYDFNEDGTRRYMMGFELPERKEPPGGLVTLHVPDQSYAVFDSRESIPDGVEIGLEIQNVWRRIYAEWFPSSIFEQVDGACIEKYYWVNENHTESICEVWIPVRRKA